MHDKDQEAEELIRHHFAMDPNTLKVVRYYSPHEADEREPIKLLEVSRSTPATCSVVGHVQTFLFSPYGSLHYPLLIGEVTPDEYEQVGLAWPLPNGWSSYRNKEYLRQ